MSALDRIEKIELAESKRKAEECLENTQLQKNKLKHSHPYDKLFLQLFWDEVLTTIIRTPCSKFIFLGAGSGNEAAYIRGRLGRDNRLVITDLSYYELQHYREVFKNYSAPFPDMVLSCSFNQLPFSKSVNEYCAVAFLCLHHSESIERIIAHILETFSQAVIFEPMTNRLLQFLSRFKITQRAEGVDYRPARLRLPFLEHLKDVFEVKVKTFIQIPRDYLPFISHEQGVVFAEADIKGEKIWSKVLFKFQLFLNYFLSRVKFGNMALIYIKRRGGK